jgi:hypothetical protein
LNQPLSRQAENHLPRMGVAMKNKLPTNRKKRALQAGLFYLLFAVAYFTFMFPEGLSLRLVIFNLALGILLMILVYRYPRE